MRRIAINSLSRVRLNASSRSRHSSLVQSAHFQTLSSLNNCIPTSLDESKNFVHDNQSRLKSTSAVVDAEQTLFDANRAMISKDNGVGGDDLDRQLRADVKTMGSILGSTIKYFEGEGIFDKVESLRLAAKAWREAGAGRDGSKKDSCDEAFKSMISTAESLSSAELKTVSRAFAHFCAIANAAEYHHRARRNAHKLAMFAISEGKQSVAALGPDSDSCGGVLPQMLKEGMSPQEIFDTLTSQQVELVLTAHPTEVNRRTLLDKHRRIQYLLTEADELRAKGVITQFQKKELDDVLKREIWLIWQSDELSRRKPSVQEEAERGTLVVETVLWEALPSFLRKLDATMIDILGDKYSLPLEAAPFKISSWMGGDRDGNPNVTPNVTREVCLRNRIRAATLLKKDLGEIAGRLSTTFCNDELREKVGPDARAPYRAYLAPMMAKLGLTIEWAEQELRKVQKGVTPDDKVIGIDEIYVTKKQLMEEMLVLHKSLCETGNHLTAEGKVLDLLRNLSAFGLTLCSLDIRQESTRHTEALDAITKHLGLGSYSEWDEETKISWLQTELTNKRPLIRRSDWKDSEAFSDTVKDTLETFKMIAEQHEDSLNAYVISQATSASDVLAVLLLQIDAGVKNPLRVVPLFETLDDLKGAAGTMKTLFNLPVYRGHINGKHEVMIGYSDSAKDAGRLAASWAQYETQEALADLAKESGIDLVFFHGKGGTVGRGGNPATFKAILSHAPDTINGRFRVTEQGEMIYQNFGHPNRAERSLDIYTAALCAEKHTTRARPTAEYRDLMNKLSDISCDAYRQIVREDERFVPYFRSATPELELANLNIGSRPAKRNPTGGVESLRAIPWNFAWTQTRHNLPTWLGVGEGITNILNSDDGDKFREMYNEFGSFRTTIDLVEMVLAKSEPSISRHYEDVLVHDEKAKELGSHIRDVHKLTEDAVLDLAGHSSFCESNELLNRMLQVRNPYVDCSNVLQAEILKRLRNCDDAEEKQVLEDALLVSITGIANGMGNTG